MKQPVRPLNRLVSRAIFCGLTAFLAAPVWAEEPLKIIRIEEHWELVLGEPDSELSAPQTSMVMSPFEDSSNIYFLFTLNHGSEPDYTPGGMQVQAWDGEHLIDERSNAESGTLSHNGETIRWVQRLKVVDGVLSFKVKNGTSDTWGYFGGESLEINMASPVSDLGDYRPGLSLTESQVNFAENRVVSLTLTKIRWQTDDYEWHEINAPIPIDVSLDP